MPKVLPAPIQWVDRLYGLHKGQPGFLIGNGWSGRYYDSAQMKRKGILLGCNLAFTKHPLDYLVWQDSAINGRCLRARNVTKVIPIRKRKRSGELGLKKDVFYFGFDRRKRGVPGAVELTNSGGIGLQLLYHFGCNPIFLVGCDCELILDKNLKFHGNVFKDKQAMKVEANGKKAVKCEEVHINGRTAYTTKALKKFAKKFKQLKNELSDVEIYKLGDFGIVDIEAIDVKEFWSDKHPNISR